MATTEASIRLHADGNIDTDRLQAELRKALEFDVQYRQTDNMKKKACKTATSYDEFKDLVACAHLKRLRYIIHFLFGNFLILLTCSRKEIESLGESKKGWQNASRKK